MIHIDNKQEFYRLSRQLLLGNILRQWDWEQFLTQCRLRTWGEPHDLPANGIVGVRHVRQSFTNKGNSGLLEIDEAIEYGLKATDKQNLLFDEGAVHDCLTIQGEVMATEQGLYVRYSHLQCHQRTLWHIAQHGTKGLKRYQLPHNLHTLTPRQRDGSDNHVVIHAEGLQAVALLQKYMDDRAWDMLNHLLGCQHGPDGTRGDELNFTYPIIEFACFDRPIGVLGWNTLFWEVRTKY